MKLSTNILVSLVLGIIFAAILNLFFSSIIIPLDQYFLSPVGNAFLRLIQFVVVPIVFSSLILGLTRIKNATQVGRYTIKLIVGYLITSFIAVGIGMVVAFFLKPGVGITGLTLGEVPTGQSQSIIDWLVSLIPVNPFEAISTGNLLQIIFASALIGVGIQLAGEKETLSFVNFVESCYVISEKILLVILYVAPLGVFALISSAIATQGFEL